VLTELKAGAPSFAWSLVHPSFSPDAAALQAAEQDVVEPWSAPVTQTFCARFTRDGTSVWRITVSTPLDGNVAVSLRSPRGAVHELIVWRPGGGVLAKGLWAGVMEKRIASAVCGERTLVVTVKRGGPAGPFVLRLTHD
jgi:hypothetical protein